MLVKFGFIMLKNRIKINNILIQLNKIILVRILEKIIYQYFLMRKKKILIFGNKFQLRK